MAYSSQDTSKPASGTRRDMATNAGLIDTKFNIEPWEISSPAS